MADDGKKKQGGCIRFLSTSMGAPCLFCCFFLSKKYSGPLHLQFCTSLYFSREKTSLLLFLNFLLITKVLTNFLLITNLNLFFQFLLFCFSILLYSESGILQIKPIIVFGNSIKPPPKVILAQTGSNSP